MVVFKTVAGVVRKHISGMWYPEHVLKPFSWNFVCGTLLESHLQSSACELPHHVSHLPVYYRAPKQVFKVLIFPKAFG